MLGLDEAAYRLAYLPPSDAFYTFEGFLGERRRLNAGYGKSGNPLDFVRAQTEPFLRAIAALP